MRKPLPAPLPIPGTRWVAVEASVRDRRKRETCTATTAATPYVPIRRDAIGRCAKAAIPEQIYKTVVEKIMTLAAGSSKLYLDDLTH
jgi:hypothetical protein